MEGKEYRSFLCARNAVRAHPDNELSGPPKISAKWNFANNKVRYQTEAWEQGTLLEKAPKVGAIPLPTPP
jgi:hypothetical protein